jgi:hypothetical protein
VTPRGDNLSIPRQGARVTKPTPDSMRAEIVASADAHVSRARFLFSHAAVALQAQRLDPDGLVRQALLELDDARAALCRLVDSGGGPRHD